MEVEVRPATLDDVSILAEMNRSLIELEGSRNPMSLDRLGERMRGWLEGNWEAALFEAEGETVGYALYRAQKDEYFPDEPEIYLRQIFIVAEHRGRSMGSQAVEQLAKRFFPAGARIVLEVLETNPALATNPGIINADPYGEGWLFEVHPTAAGPLLTAAEYAERNEVSA